jgi:hypothetical protein
MTNQKPPTMPQWAQDHVITTYRTVPAPRWIRCTQCGGTGLVRGLVGGYETACSCTLCGGSGGRFEL